MELMDIVAELKNASVQMPEEKIDQFIEAVDTHLCIRDRKVRPDVKSAGHETDADGISVLCGGGDHNSFRGKRGPVDCGFGFRRDTERVQRGRRRG